MKLFSDLRLNNHQATEQFTALILAGVAAVVIGGVAHMGMHRNGLRTAAPTYNQEIPVAEPVFAGNQPEETVIATAEAAIEVAPVVVEPLPLLVSGTLPPLALAPVASAPVAQLAAALEQPVKPELIVRTAEITRANALGKLLTTEADLDDAEVKALTKALSGVYKGGYARGLEVSLRFTQRGEQETFDGLSFQPEPTAEVRVLRLANGVFKAEKLVTPLQRQRRAVEGTVRTTLIEAGLSQGVPRNVMSSMMRAFSHEVDFQRDLRAGAKFRVLYDQPHTKSGQPAGDATIIYAAIDVRGEKKAIFRVIYNDGTSEYFNDEGVGVKRGLMRTPIDGAHVSSSFGMRRHPILGYSKFHQGVDFAAPTGTPVFAAGDGVVKERGWRNGYGNFVLLQHNGGLQTAYGHMSRFARGLNVGDRVNQGEVIAFVGSTGRSTGPHLHFEVRVNEQPINPLNVSMQVGSRLTGKSLTQFKTGKVEIEAEFKRRATATLDKPAVKLAAN